MAVNAENLTSFILIAWSLKKITINVLFAVRLTATTKDVAIVLCFGAIKLAKKSGEKVAVVLFDFTDAFGNVNRIRLLERVRSAFGVKGKLFNHIADFLKSRKARIKVNELVGEWLDSTTGTSAL